MTSLASCGRQHREHPPNVPRNKVATACTLGTALSLGVRHCRTGGGLIALSRRLASDPPWSGSANYTLATGVVIIVLLVAQIALA